MCIPQFSPIWKSDEMPVEWWSLRYFTYPQFVKIRSFSEKAKVISLSFGSFLYDFEYPRYTIFTLADTLFCTRFIVCVMVISDISQFLAFGTSPITPFCFKHQDMVCQDLAQAFYVTFGIVKWLPLHLLQLTWMSNEFLDSCTKIIVLSGIAGLC